MSVLSLEQTGGFLYCGPDSSCRRFLSSTCPSTRVFHPTNLCLLHRCFLFSWIPHLISTHRFSLLSKTLSQQHPHGTRTPDDATPVSVSHPSCAHRTPHHTFNKSIIGTDRNEAHRTPPIPSGSFQLLLRRPRNRYNYTLKPSPQPAESPADPRPPWSTSTTSPSLPWSKSRLPLFHSPRIVRCFCSAARLSTSRCS